MPSGSFVDYNGHFRKFGHYYAKELVRDKRRDRAYFRCRTCQRARQKSRAPKVARSEPAIGFIDQHTGHAYFFGQPYQP